MAENPTLAHWTEHLVRYLSENGAGTEDDIRAAGEQFSYTDDGSQRNVTWNEHDGLHTVTIATAPDALLRINDALADLSSGGLDAIAEKYLIRFKRSRSAYLPVEFRLDLEAQHATWRRGNHFPNGGFPRTYETFEAIVSEGLDALDRHSLDELSSNWRSGPKIIR